MDNDHDSNGQSVLSRFADAIAELCYAKYRALPKTGKPGEGEWTALAAIVKVRARDEGAPSDGKDSEVVALGTGSKCVGRSKLSPDGDVVNDGHAEVMARRGFVRYLYHQVLLMYETGASDVFSTVERGRCILRKDISFHFFVSHTPCGDASIFPKAGPHDDSGEPLWGEDVGDCEFEGNAVVGVKRRRDGTGETGRRKVAKGETGDGVPSCWCGRCGNLIEREWEDIYRTGARCLPEGPLQDDKLVGKGYHVLGALRTKPGRGDPTTSLSCSDKLARWVAVGLQGALASLLVAGPVSVSSVVVAGGCPYSRDALARAVVRRTRAGTKEPAPLLLRASTGFVDARRCGLRPCAASVVWCNVPSRPHEVCVDGKKQGVTKKCARGPAGRLLISKREMLEQFAAAVCVAPNAGLLLPGTLSPGTTASPACLRDALSSLTYRQLKDAARDHQESWSEVKKTCFPSWIEKPHTLLQFTLQS